MLGVKHTCDHAADSHGVRAKVFVQAIAVGSPIQDAGVKRHHRGYLCQGRIHHVCQPKSYEDTVVFHGRYA